MDNDNADVVDDLLDDDVELLRALIASEEVQMDQPPNNDESMKGNNCDCVENAVCKQMTLWMKRTMSFMMKRAV